MAAVWHDCCPPCVAQDCYGLREVPDGDWFCDLCAARRRKPSLGSVRCHFCPSKVGAFKRTQKRQWGGWVHVACTLFYPHTGFSDEERKKYADGFERKEVNPTPLLLSSDSAPAPTRSLQRGRCADAIGRCLLSQMLELLSSEISCSLCSQKPTRGAKARCREPGCTAYFHPTCAIGARLPIVPPDEDFNCLGAYCAEHANGARAALSKEAESSREEASEEADEVPFNVEVAQMSIAKILESHGAALAIGATELLTYS